MKLITNNPAPLYTFYERHLKNELLLPPHQKLRGDVWPDGKKKKWYEDIQKNEMISGVIITYKLKDDPNQRMYINDGANRVIHSLKQFVEQCKTPGEEKDYQSILYRCSIVEQRVEYESNQEAIDHYININMGTVATPYEILQCRFVSELDNYEHIWADFFSELHSSMSDILCRLGCSNKRSNPNNRDNTHRMRRDNLALFYRFASKEKSKWSPKVASKVISPEAVKKEDQVEHKLSKWLREQGRERAGEMLESFRRFISDQYAFYHQKWLECGLPTTKAPSPSNFRWWLGISVYRYNNNFDLDKFAEFTKRFLHNTKGETNCIYNNVDGRPKSVAVALGKVNMLATFVRAAGLDMADFEAKKSVRRKPKGNLKAGFVHSHINAFSAHGEGETVPENAVDNRHRLNRDMTDEEADLLKKLA